MITVINELQEKWTFRFYFSHQLRSRDNFYHFNLPWMLLA